MSCDGNIAQEELKLVKQFAATSSYFENIDIQNKLNEYVDRINHEGLKFLSDYINDISLANIDETQEQDIVKIAIRVIQEDNKIEYSEISFFKKIRAKLQISDEIIKGILEKESLFDKYPEIQPEDFLLPDIQVTEDLDWHASFDVINLDLQ